MISFPRGARRQIISAQRGQANYAWYFIDSGIIGTKGFVLRCYELAMEAVGQEREKRPVTVAGLPGVYSLKRLSEKL